MPACLLLLMTNFLRVFVAWHLVFWCQHFVTMNKMQYSWHLAASILICYCQESFGPWRGCQCTSGEEILDKITGILVTWFLHET